MVLGFPPIQRKRKKGSHDALQEGKMSPGGGTASVSDELTRISPENPLHNLRRSVAKEPCEDEP